MKKSSGCNSVYIIIEWRQWKKVVGVMMFYIIKVYYFWNVYNWWDVPKRKLYTIHWDGGSTWQSINLSSPNPNPQIKQHTSMALFSNALQQAFMPKHEYDNLREQDKALIQLQRPILISLLLCIVIVIVTSLVTPIVEVWWMGRYICF